MADRIDFTTLEPGVRLVPVVLVAGVPVVIVPAGVHPTTTATSGSLDSSWWPGSGSLTQTLPGPTTFDPVKEWLDPTQEFIVETKARTLTGDVEQSALNIDLFDVDGAVTASLSARDSFVGALLHDDFDVGATTLTLQAQTGFAASGIACIGRETIIYTSAAGGVLTIGVGGQRGAYGSREVFHGYSPTQPSYVTCGGPRWWFGRRLSFFIAKLSADGTTLTDPTLMFLGVVGKGIQLMERGTRWRVPADSILEVLTRKIETRTIKPSGIAHYKGADRYIDTRLTPLAAVWADDDDPVLADTGVALCADSASPHSGGWHDSWETFLDAWNTQAATVNATAPAKASMLGNGHLFILGDGVTALYDEAYLRVWATWDSTVADCGVQGNPNPSNSASSWTSRSPAPACFVPLDGKVKLSPDDYARIPSTLSYVSGDTRTNARWMLTMTNEDSPKYSVLSSNPREVVALPAPTVIAARDGTAETITVCQMLWGTGTVSFAAPVLTSPTELALGLYVEGDRWDHALQLAATALDDLAGADYHSNSVDWSSLGDAIDASTPGGLPTGRRYMIRGGTDDSFLDYLVTEVRMMGMALCIKHGRISVYKPGDLASTEIVARTVTASDLVGLPGVEDAHDGMVTSCEFTLPGGDTVSHVDNSWRDQFGDCGTVKITASRSVDTINFTTLDSLFRDVAWSIITPLAQPQRAITMTLPLPFYDLSTGDVVSLTHPMVPGWGGFMGVTSALCQVQSVSLYFCGGKAEVKAVARLGDSDLVGYAPEGLVAAGGLTDGSPDVVLSGTTVWSTNGFAQPGTGTGGASSFQPGDKVILVELDNATPASQTGLEVSSVSGATVTLTTNVNATMAALAVDPYKVLLKFADYDTVTAAQRAYAFIADEGTYELGSANVLPHRWG